MNPIKNMNLNMILIQIKILIIIKILYFQQWNHVKVVLLFYTIK